VAMSTDSEGRLSTSFFLKRENLVGSIELDENTDSREIKRVLGEDEREGDKGTTKTTDFSLKGFFSPGFSN